MQISDSTTNVNNRPVAVITGACGGMGRVCATQLSGQYRLALVDVDSARVEALAQSLRQEGANVVLAMALDIGAAEQVGQLADALSRCGPLGALVHTAGLSPALCASWETIMRVNFAGTVYLLDALEPLIIPGTVAVLIASVAGHSIAPAAALHSALDTCPAAEFMPLIEAGLVPLCQPGDPLGMASPAYAVSKYGVIRLCQQRARRWSARGGRLVSISPGIIATPMGQAEVDTNVMAAALMATIPGGHMGTPQDIANAVEFLCSEKAAYINGTDLLIDCGVSAGQRAS